MCRVGVKQHSLTQTLMIYMSNVAKLFFPSCSYCWRCRWNLLLWKI